MRRLKAFTLIELVIAFVIFSGLLTLVYNVIMQTRMVNRHVDNMGEELLEPYLAMKMFYEDCERYASCPGWAKDRRAFKRFFGFPLTLKRFVFWARLSRPKSLRGIHLIEYSVENGKLTRKIFRHEKGSSLDISNYTKFNPVDTTQYLLDLHSISVSFRTSVEKNSKIWTQSEKQPEPPFVRIKLKKAMLSTKYDWIVPFGPAN